MRGALDFLARPPLRWFLVIEGLFTALAVLALVNGDLPVGLVLAAGVVYSLAWRVYDRRQR